MRAQGLLTFVVVALLFLGGVMALNFMRDDVTTARSSATGMDCTNTAISDGAKMTCLGIDIALPYFIICFLSIAGGLIFEKLTI